MILGSNGISTLKRYKMRALVMTWSSFILLGVFMLLGESVLGVQAQYNSRSKRQVTYHEGSNSSQEDDRFLEEHYFTPATKKPLPAQMVYPGDLSSFYTKDSSVKGESHSSKETNVRAKPIIKNKSHNRKKRGVLIATTFGRPSPRIVHKVYDERLLQSEDRIRASYLHGGHSKPGGRPSPSNNIPAEMSFDGAGFLRTDISEEVALHIPSEQLKSHSIDNRNHMSRQKNEQALKAFKAAFNPAIQREINPVQYDDEEEHLEGQPHLKGSLLVEKKQSRPGIDISASDLTMKMNHREHKTTAQYIPASSEDTSSIPIRGTPLYYNPEFFDSRFLRTASNSPHKAEDSAILNHRLSTSQTLSLFNDPNEISTNPFFLYHRLQSHIPIKGRRKRSASVYQTVKGNPVNVHEESAPENSAPDELKSSASKTHDYSKSSTGFIPISFNGGTIHLPLPFYSGHSPPPPSPRYSPRSPVYTYHSYPPPVRPESRHFGSSGPSEHFFHPSEARRYSYGVLGSGNFEVISGGIFPYESHHNRHHGGNDGFHDGRSAYGSNNFNNYGTTEIIIDGPIRGFQGFDNIPAHLINALTKHTEFAVHSPERKQDESQLIPVSYPLQAVP